MKNHPNCKAKKTATNNEWTSASHTQSTSGTQYTHEKALKSATNNQWTSPNMPEE